MSAFQYSRPPDNARYPSRMSLRRLLFGHALVALIGASAVAGCSGDPAPTQRAYIQSTVGTGVDGSAACGVTDPDWVTIGDASTAKNDGDDQAGLQVHVSCSVTSAGDGSFNVNAVAALGNKGSVTVTGKFTTTGDQSNIRAVFGRGDFGQFTDTACTVSYTLHPGLMGVAAGRVWGYIDCEHAADPNQQRMDSKGNPIARTCKAQGEFKFENCSQ
jgi:hypothetical protein